MKRTITVCCAVIRHKDLFFIAQRSSEMSMPGKWEFPGGKSEANETFEAALQRELLEELNYYVSNLDYLGEFTYHYPDLTIQLIAFESLYTGDKMRLKEHVNHSWVKLEELDEFDFTEADLLLIDFLKKRAT
jgi:8-oxo-dGTP diphosphatase